MKRISKFVLALLALSIAAIAPAQKANRVEFGQSGDVVRFNLIQINDVYEITPVSGEGGMAKLATILNAYRTWNPNTYLVLAGDFFSPSALGTAKVNGERLAGQQMVAILNLLPLTLATFGNHEFDVTEGQFKKRLDESTFGWISSNTLSAQDQLFPKVAENRIQVIGDGTKKVRVGYFGLTIPSNPKPYVKYTDVMATAEKQVRALRPNVDVLIAITHLAYEDDLKLAKAFPEIDMIIGGHEHEHHRIEIASLAGIYKADANARTVYVHEFVFDPVKRSLGRRSHLERLTADVPEDPAVKSEVDKWVQIAYDGFRKDGFNPDARVADVPIALDGSEASVRNRPTALTDLIARGMLSAAPGAQAAIFNGGSIRIDDVIQPGVLTEYDVIRILPFGGKIVSIEISGAFLEKILIQGVANKGQGGYLQTANIERDGSGWKVNGSPLDPAKNYVVAISDFLLTGNEQNLGFLKRDAPEIKVLKEHDDIRNATIAHLKKTYPAKD